MDRPDIIIYFSDQHNYNYSGFSGNKIVKTPNLDKLAEDGVAFTNAYTSCPLCVPARISFLTGQYASKTGVFTNEGTIASDCATFLHSVASLGYETVLCGRMHFVGEDQRHGFTKRIAHDMGSEGLGPYYGTRGHLCTKVFGGGNSPVLAYDRTVIDAALKYLEQDHEKPQCIVVGTYAPHFPYVSPEDLYLYYKDIVDLPMTYMINSDYEVSDMVMMKKSTLDEEKLKKIRAAYYGMISFMDEQIGFIRNSWEKYLSRNNREGVFIYLSDHGDMAGEHELHGKTVLYEGSAKIPLIFQGHGFKKGLYIDSTVSITDVAPTICELLNAELPSDLDGKSLLSHIKTGICENLDENRFVISEFVEEVGNNIYPAIMIKKGRWKFIRYFNHDVYDMLFDTTQDPFEINNVIADFPEIKNEMLEKLGFIWDPDKIIIKYKNNKHNHKIIEKWENVCNYKEKEYRSTLPEEAKLPVVI